jgi:excisionase family DNA binding protein
MTAIGDLKDFVKYNMGRALAEGKAGTAGIGAELAAGLAMGQSMLQPGGLAAPGRVSPPGFVPPASGAPTSAGPAELLTPEKVAQVLSVEVSDVLRELDSGKLKGRRIGSQWRISRAALDAFMGS